MQALVLLLSVAVLYFFLVGQTWRRHTISANRRRKRVEWELRSSRSFSEALKFDIEGLQKHHRVLAQLLDEKREIIDLFRRESEALEKECVETRELLTERVVGLQVQLKIATDLVHATEKTLARSQEAYTIANAAAIQNGWYRQICERIETLPEMTNASERYRLTRRNAEGKWVPVRKPRLPKNELRLGWDDLTVQEVTP